MLMRSSDFYETLPPKCCNTCGERMEELADCYTTTCAKCRGITFYPLSPAVSSVRSLFTAVRPAPPAGD